MSVEYALPSGLVLAKDETAVATRELSAGLLPFAKTRLVLTSKRLAGVKANTFLGIPTGSERMSYPLANIASVHVGTKISIPGLLFGGLLSLVALANLGQGSGMIVLLVIGALIFINAFSAVFSIQNNAGSTIAHRVGFLDRTSAQSFCEEVNTAIAAR